LIEIRDLYKYYGARRALGPVSLKIDDGEIVGLLGLNGAGKTTALRILACDLLPSGGTVLVDGIDVVERPEDVRSKIGYLPDVPPLYGEMTVSEYLAFAARLRGVPKAEVDRRVADVEATTRVESVAGDPIATLSHGFRQRVGIAQAIVHDPKLVVLDEPISGLDPKQIKDMRRMVKNLGGKHTVLVSSHILSEISETCDRILVIRDGEIVASGTEAELSRQLLEGVRVRVTVRLAGGASNGGGRARDVLAAVDGVRAVESTAVLEPGDDLLSFTVEAASDVRAALSRAVIQSGLSLVELSRHERELESVFLRLASPDAAQEVQA
jgi:ABC-2 type transport system ATP-binding protein